MSSRRFRLASPLSVAGGALFLMLAHPAFADVEDPLHGYCAGAGQCVDDGTNSPTSTNPSSNFGFTISPGPRTGDLSIDVLVPNNEPKPANFALTGTLSGTATLFSATPWTSGDLDAYLGLSASPATPIGGYLPSTVALDPGATGFFVFNVNLGTAALQGASNPNVSPLENISPGLPMASYLVTFLNGTIATANSGAILATHKAPEPASMTLLGTGLAGLGFALRLRRRSRNLTSN